MKFYSFKLICEECKQEASIEKEEEKDWDKVFDIEVKAICNCGNEEIL